MRRWAVFALELALCLGFATVASAAEPGGDVQPAAEKSSGNWFTRMFGFGHGAPDKPAEPKAAKDEASVPSKAALLEVAKAKRDQEEHALFRRQKVCIRLREIADRTNDDELRRKAEQLDQRAWELYVQRTGQSSAGGADDRSDEAIVNRHLGTATGRAGAAPANSSREARDGVHAAAKGEMP
jgi:hypothetical protein